MRIDRLLHLEAGDVLAPTPDRVLKPIDEIEVSVLVASTAIAGVKPQVAPGLDGLPGQIEIAEHGAEWLLRPDDQLAHLSRRHLVIVLVDDPHLELVERPSHRTRPRRLVQSRDRDAVQFGRPVRVDRLHAESPLELELDARRHRRTENGAHCHAPISRGLRRLVKEDVRHRPQQTADGGAVRPRLAPVAAGGESRAHRGGRAGQDRGKERRLRVAVKERQARQPDVGVAGVEPACHEPCPPVVVAVRAEDALRRAGRAAGVENRRRARRIDRHAGIVVRRTVDQCIEGHRRAAVDEPGIAIGTSLFRSTTRSIRSSPVSI